MSVLPSGPTLPVLPVVGSHTTPTNTSTRSRACVDRDLKRGGLYKVKDSDAIDDPCICEYDNVSQR
jgi:hypothetical protein